MDANPYAAALTAVEARIARAAAAARREPGSVELLAVSKTHPPAAVRAFYELGLRHFGENYAQELAAKAEALFDLPDLSWSFIGTVQSNKLPLIVRHADEIQGVTSLDHARKIDRLAAALNKKHYSIYLAVNAVGEKTKHGVALAAALPLAAAIAAELPGLRLRGLMAIPPPLGELESSSIPPLYTELAALARKVGEGRLSLGLTGDLEAAVGAGSDCVRIGTALFGARGPR
jgi:pyridoxal phosphate enzyme (YggS family)